MPTPKMPFSQRVVAWFLIINFTYRLGRFSYLVYLAYNSEFHQISFPGPFPQLIMLLYYILLNVFFIAAGVLLNFSLRWGRYLFLFLVSANFLMLLYQPAIPALAILFFLFNTSVLLYFFVFPESPSPFNLLDWKTVVLRTITLGISGVIFYYVLAWFSYADNLRLGQHIYVAPCVLLAMLLTSATATRSRNKALALRDVGTMLILSGGLFVQNGIAQWAFKSSSLDQLNASGLPSIRVLTGLLIAVGFVLAGILMLVFYGKAAAHQRTKGLKNPTANEDLSTPHFVPNTQRQTDANLSRPYAPPEEDS